MRILVLEDDKDLGPWIVGGLREEGHVVDHFVDGKDALIAAMGQDYELLILDRMVPGLDGLSVLKSLRASKNSTPALFLTALGEVDSRVEGFEAGGDDYLTKPFAFIELSARVNALGRRGEPAGNDGGEQTVLTHGDVRLDLLSRRCERQGQCRSGPFWWWVFRVGASRQGECYVIEFSVLLLSCPSLGSKRSRGS